jgi:hypothetical protein|tara:strand:+ start:426 stop:845 length:420 start_codon:yes stop_codon:yes gene_type:complete
MADTVTSQTIVDTSGTKTVMKFTNISDGTGETLVTKMDASALTHMTTDATKKISKIWWSCNTNSGNGGVELIWAGSGTTAANASALFLSGQGYWDLHTAGNGIGNNATITADTSPAGDILFSTKNFTNGDSYSIVVEVR